MTTLTEPKKRKVAPSKTIEIPELNLQSIEIRVRGITPLICHAWSKKAKLMMLNKQMGTPTEKEFKDPEQDYLDSMYWLSPRPQVVTPGEIVRARFGFPAVAFKAAMTGACRQSKDFKMTELRQLCHITGDEANPDYVEILCPGGPEKREDMVRLGGLTADIRYRAQFVKWSVVLAIEFNAEYLSHTQIVQMLNLAGFGVGVGEWRPERDGSFGRFKVSE